MQKSSKITYMGTGAWCIVPNCYNKRQFTNVVFFSFPKDKARCDAWLINCGREDLLKLKIRKTQVICAHHFEDGNFMDPFHKRLKPNAMPTIFPTSPKGSLVSAAYPKLVPLSKSTLTAVPKYKNKSHRQLAQELLLRRRDKEEVEDIILKSNESREMVTGEEEENLMQPLENVSSEAINFEKEPYFNSNSNVSSLVLECESVEVC